MLRLHNTLSKKQFFVSPPLFSMLENHEPRTAFKRRSRLYIPLTKERFFEKSKSLMPDGFIFDLEDSIPCHLKWLARENIAKLPEKRPGVEHILRVNAYDTPFWKEDLKALKRYPFDSIIIPKAESAQQLSPIFEQIAPYNLNRIVLIETLKGLSNVREIVSILKPGDAIGYGAGDLSMAFGVQRTPIFTSQLLQHVLMQVLLAAKEHQIDVFDPPYRHYSDLHALEKEAEFCRSLGTTGKQAIHPAQIETINRIYSPSEAEINQYIREFEAFHDAPEMQAISIEGRYVGKPSKLTATQKLLEFYDKGYITLIKQKKVECA